MHGTLLDVNSTPMPTRKVRALAKTFLKGALAILDQGLVSGSNFVIGIFLARWLTAKEYGAYAVAFGIFLLVANLYQSWVIEPMAVFGPSTHRGSLRAYLKSLIWIYVGTILLIVVCLCLSALFALRNAPTSQLPIALVGVAIATPAILFFWSVKRVFYLQLSPAPSAVGACVYCAVAGTGLWQLYHRGRMTPFSAFVLMGIAALGTSLPLWLRLQFRLPRTAGQTSPRATLSQHWRYGKWAMATAALMWVPMNVFYPLLSSFSGVDRAGELKALMNLASPVLQSYGALSALLLPYTSRAQQEGGPLRTAALARHISWLFAAGAILYWAILLTFKESIFHALYSGRYMNVTGLLPVVALSSVAWSAFLGPTTGLRAMQSPALIMIAVSASTVVSLIVGVPAVYFFGLSGAVWAMTLSEIAGFAMTFLFLEVKVRSAGGPADVEYRLLAPLLRKSAIDPQSGN